MGKKYLRRRLMAFYTVSIFEGFKPRTNFYINLTESIKFFLMMPMTFLFKISQKTLKSLETEIFHFNFSQSNFNMLLRCIPLSFKN